MFTTDDPTQTPFVSAGSQAAARLLEIAANNADQLMAESRAEAASMVATAHADADQLTAASQAEADQLTSSARAEADQLLAAARTEAQRVSDEVEQHRTQQTQELEQHRRDALADVSAAKATLEAQVNHLQQLEREHVERMRTYLTGQLDQLERVARTDEAPVGPWTSTPTRHPSPTTLPEQRHTSTSEARPRSTGPGARGHVTTSPRCQEMFRMPEPWSSPDRPDRAAVSVPSARVGSRGKQIHVSLG